MLSKTGMGPPRSPKSSVRQPTSNSRSAPSTYSTSPIASAALMKSSNDEYGIPAPPKCYLQRGGFRVEVIYHLHPVLSNQLCLRSIITSNRSPVTRWKQTKETECVLRYS